MSYPPNFEWTNGKGPWIALGVVINFKDGALKLINPQGSNTEWGGGGGGLHEDKFSQILQTCAIPELYNDFP